MMLLHGMYALVAMLTFIQVAVKLTSLLLETLYNMKSLLCNNNQKMHGLILLNLE